MDNKTLTALTGIRVGHSTHLDKLTGCTFISFDKELPVAYKSYGGSPGTYATENLNNGMSFASRDGLFIAGGSLNGLTCATGIIERLVEKKQGYKIGNSHMPAISGAIIWDLGVEQAQFEASYGKEAVDNLSDKPVENGNVGAGTGAIIGKFQYLEQGKSNGAMKAGIGSARVDLGNGITICALSVVNALGNVISPDGSVFAGNRKENGGFTTFEEVVQFVTAKQSNTTISIVGINVNLKSRESYERIAHFGTQGQVRAINPVQTSVDGDTVFVFSTQEVKAPLNSSGKYWETPAWPEFTIDVIGQATARAVQESIYDACNKAETIKFEKAYKGIIPSIKEYSA
jgi:L-aminopeptidase/D-esterase-like protein